MRTVGRIALGFLVLAVVWVAVTYVLVTEFGIPVWPVSIEIRKA